jgi:hypothetical protein
MPGGWIQKGYDRTFEGLCDWRGNHFGFRLHDRKKRALPHLDYTLAFALQLRKITENLR